MALGAIRGRDRATSAASCLENAPNAAEPAAIVAPLATRSLTVPGAAAPATPAPTAPAKIGPAPTPPVANVTGAATAVNPATPPSISAASSPNPVGPGNLFLGGASRRLGSALSAPAANWRSAL